MLDAKEKSRLVQLLGMTGSAHDGEALNASRLAGKLVRDRNMTWGEVLDSDRGLSRVAEQLAQAKKDVERLQKELARKVPKPTTKDRRTMRACTWCRKKFAPRAEGRLPKYCSARCRQSAHQKQKGDWRAKMADELLQQRRAEQVRSDLIPILRHELLAELVQSGVARITSPVHIDMFMAKRNDWRGNKVLHELEAHFREMGDEIALAALAQWRQARKSW